MRDDFFFFLLTLHGAVRKDDDKENGYLDVIFPPIYMFTTLFILQEDFEEGKCQMLMKGSEQLLSWIILRSCVCIILVTNNVCVSSVLALVSCLLFWSS